jgi:nucleotide-binding universal stress UspA family protein
MNLDKILVCVDGSAQADSVTDVAASLAKKCGALLIILHVVETMPSGRLRPELDDFLSQRRGILTRDEIAKESGRHIVEAAERRARQMGGERLDTVVAIGATAAQIVDVAHARGIDLIVLGRRGHGRMGELMAGSVSLKVIHTSKIPVLTVPWAEVSP